MLKKRLTPDTWSRQLVQDASVSLESFKVTGLVVFLELLKEAVDELHERAKPHIKLA